jgi:predicted dehydrogenase
MFFMKLHEVRIGIIGGGLMGREIAAGFARWCALTDVSVRPVMTAVADLNPAALEWFEGIPSCTFRTTDYHALINHPDVDVVYAAVPHNLHEQVYCDTLAAGKDLLAEKPFGIDLAAARNILGAVRRSGRFVRCSSEMPFFPGAQRAVEYARSGALGRVLEVVSGFHHGHQIAAERDIAAEPPGKIGLRGRPFRVAPPDIISV